MQFFLQLRNASKNFFVTSNLSILFLHCAIFPKISCRWAKLLFFYHKLVLCGEKFRSVRVHECNHKCLGFCVRDDYALTNYPGDIKIPRQNVLDNFIFNSPGCSAMLNCPPSTVCHVLFNPTKMLISCLNSWFDS